MNSLEHIDADLDSHLFEALDLTAVNPADLDDDSADRSLRRLARIELDMSRYETIARRRKQDIDDWLEDRLSGLVGQRDFLMRCLETYARATHEVTGAKSVNLPSGSVALRQAPPRIDAAGEPGDDVDARLIRVTRAWDKRAVKDTTAIGPQLEDHDTPEGFVAYAAVTGDGEILPGVVYLVRTEPTFDAKPVPIGGAR